MRFIMVPLDSDGDRGHGALGLSMEAGLATTWAPSLDRGNGLASWPSYCMHGCAQQPHRYHARAPTLMRISCESSNLHAGAPQRYAFAHTQARGSSSPTHTSFTREPRPCSPCKLTAAASVTAASFTARGPTAKICPARCAAADALSTSPGRVTPPRCHLAIKSSQVRSGQVKSSQVKSSQVKCGPRKGQGVSS